MRFDDIIYVLHCGKWNEWDMLVWALLRGDTICIGTLTFRTMQQGKDGGGSKRKRRHEGYGGGGVEGQRL